MLIDLRGEDLRAPRDAPNLRARPPGRHDLVRSASAILGCVVLVVLVVAAVVSVLIAVATFLAQRRAAARMVDLDSRLTITEADTGRCGACDGQGYRWEPSGGAG